MKQDTLSKEQEELVTKNLKLVFHMVNKLNLKYDQYDDIISIGKIGLVKAAMTFDETKGITFSTYASRCINNEIFMHFRKEKKHEKVVLLEDPVNQDSEGNVITLGDTIPSAESYFAEELANKDLVIKLISIILNLLEPRKRQIMLYKISGMEQHSIAKIFNISRSYVSRIEHSLKKEIESYLTTTQQYKEVFSMAIVGDSYKISFSSKEVNYFNKIFATFLENLKSAETLPDFKISCNKERIIVFVPAHPQSFSFIAQIIREIDDYTVSFVKEVSTDSEVLEEINSKAVKKKVKEEDSVETVEEDKTEEVVSVTEESNIENSEETLTETSQEIISDNLSPSIEGDKSNPTSINSITKKSNKTKSIEEYIIKKGTVTFKELKENFKDIKVGTISYILNAAQKRGLITSIGRGKYTVKKA